jgi:predicted nucleic acid-binding protein
MLLVEFPVESQFTLSQSFQLFGHCKAMSNPSVYVETTVVGHIAARQQSDIVVAARQLLSNRWWATRDDYRLYISQIVIDECSAGDAKAASERLLLLAELDVLAISQDARNLAAELIIRRGVPESEPRDALHISIAAVHGIQYLVTWNFRHIANAETRSKIEQICRDFGYVPPSICSPDELLGA